MKYIFGPVPSRRLGYSLGVDIIPYKTCSFDCIYCELGKTDCRTLEPVGSVSPEAVLQELEKALSSPAPNLDYITITGSGEPTLHPRLGLIIKEIRKMTSRPIALITNSSLLYQEEVLENALKADVVIPSLDAPDPVVFQTINRPHPSLTFERLIEGLVNLGRSPGARIWLEVLFLKGINDSPGQIEQFDSYIRQINPEKVQLNTVVRPPVEDYAGPLSFSRLQEIQRALGPRSEIITPPTPDRTQDKGSITEVQIRDMVTRRPCTAEDIALCLGLPLTETVRLLNGMLQAKKVTYEVFNHQGFYRGV
jgi:wyosine [tRNA(Phe)-imidazoG37] synthetase (radical SAM superfamily)